MKPAAMLETWIFIRSSPWRSIQLGTGWERYHPCAPRINGARQDGKSAASNPDPEAQRPSRQPVHPRPMGVRAGEKSLLARRPQRKAQFRWVGDLETQPGERRIAARGSSHTTQVRADPGLRVFGEVTPDDPDPRALESCGSCRAQR